MINKFIFLQISLIMVANVAPAQKKQHKFNKDSSIVVDAGTKLNDVIPAKDLFQYAEFSSGKVYFRDGKVSEAKLNYSRLMDEMLFISQSGDTLAIDNEPTIKLISIGTDTFYYDQGYIMLVKSTNVVKLGVKHGFKLGDKRKETGYSMMSSASSVTSFSSLFDGRRMYQLKVKEQTVVFKVTNYYFGNKFNRFVLATRNNLFDLLPKCTVLLQEFFKKNKIGFGKRNDLERLVSSVAYGCVKAE